MAATQRCLAGFIRGEVFTRPSIVSASHLSAFFCPMLQTRSASNRPVSSKEKAARDKAKKKKKKHSMFKQYDLKDAEQFSLCDAMRYIRAFEVGRSSISSKYELHIRLKTKKDGPIIRNQIRLPHPVKTNLKVAVICPPDSKAATAARSAGASLVGEEAVFEVVKSGKMDFDRLIAHPESMPKLQQAGLGRILGPRGLMPSVKLGTVVERVGEALKNMMGGSMYRERAGVLHMAIGQLGFTPDEMRANLRAFIDKTRQDAAGLAEQIPKDIHEVVLSSTNSPGFTLSGEFRTDQSPPLQALSNS